ncbi:MAG: hypothetical protein N2Z23_10635 [Pyrinomonadaceae bacterium]|nr:hypothetical protein [Pyrinomonadaceae bacterium]MCX7640881.1 hypothetical protein [Pyrinomonadaceae bacterium]MDW8304685.1 hypothetical protein [Acidobacteriota bacterium]
MKQQSLFDEVQHCEIEKIALYALGEFQTRGHKLADRQLALDRLLGAFRRAAEHFQATQLTDEQIAETLERLGAKVKKVPSFFAKHPFRITVPLSLAEKARKFFDEQNR